jgi:hypothetical protein
MQILQGACLNPEERDRLAKKLGRVLSEEVWQHSITGHRILVCPEPVSDRFKGLIYKPRSATEREGLEMGAGWIIAVGPLAGSGDEWFPGGLIAKAPADLLGLHVIFKSHNGVNIKTSEEDTEFGGQFSLLVMTTRDILMVGEGL